MDYKNLDNQELSALMVNLISRTQKLYDDISEYELRSRNSRIVRCGIQNEYRTLIWFF